MTIETYWLVAPLALLALSLPVWAYLWLTRKRKYRPSPDEIAEQLQVLIGEHEQRRAQANTEADGFRTIVGLAPQSHRRNAPHG